VKRQVDKRHSLERVSSTYQYQWLSTFSGRPGDSIGPGLLEFGVPELHLQY
jgi:hypothetical protein